MSNGVEEQLAAWVKGNPTHNTIRDECCPDFSCCNPELLAPEEVRREFVEAGETKRHEMLMGFLGAAFVAAGTRDKTYIAGMDGAELN